MKICKGKEIQLLGTLKRMYLGEIRKIWKNVLNKVENNKKLKVMKYLNT